MDITKLSINQKTTIHWSLPECIDGCVRHKIPSIGIRREKIKEIGVKESALLLRNSGLKVSSLCFAGNFPYLNSNQRRERLDDNRRAIEEAFLTKANVLVIVGGVLPNGDIKRALSLIERGIDELLPYAQDSNIKLGIEPLHPMFAASHSALVTMEETNNLLDHYDSPYLGIIIDAYHVWWDPKLYEQIERSKKRIFGFHVNDWITPIYDYYTSRGMMGDGFIKLKQIRKAVEKAGYEGPIEVEIFNSKLWDTSYDEVLELCKERFRKYV